LLPLRTTSALHDAFMSAAKAVDPLVIVGVLYEIVRPSRLPPEPVAIRIKNELASAMTLIHPAEVKAGVLWNCCSRVPVTVSMTRM
jgi:hypothetical protein